MKLYFWYEKRLYEVLKLYRDPQQEIIRVQAKTIWQAKEFSWQQLANCLFIISANEDAYEW